MRVWAMAQTVSVLPDAVDMAKLGLIAGDRFRPLKQIQRARIILFSVECLSVQDVTRRAGGRQPPGRVALAAALRREGRRGSAAQQDAPARHADPSDRDGGRGAGPDLHGAPTGEVTH